MMNTMTGTTMRERKRHTRRQIAIASSSGSRMSAFGGDGFGGGNMVPSLELVDMPVPVGGWVAEEGTTGAGAPEVADFRVFEDPAVGGLRMIRALGGMVMA